MFKSNKLVFNINLLNYYNNHIKCRCFSDYLDQYQNILHRNREYGQQPYRNNDPRVGFEPVPIVKEETEKISRMKNISKAMAIYLERTKQFEKFMTEKQEEYEIGRRHLANMMGVDESLMTQKDIDLVIQYLMPSGLFEPRARPIMKPPEQLYPKQKKAQFNIEGRPNHALFYTTKHNFYQICYDIQENLEKLNQFEDQMIRKGVIQPPSDAKIELTASRWLDYKELKQLLLEKFDEKKYQFLIDSLNRLVDHPYSKQSEDFIMKYRKEIQQVTSQMKIPPLMYDEQGRAYQTAIGRRKFCVAYVTVRENGTGKIDINGKDITYFDFIQDREQVMTPLKFCGLLFKVDIECKTMHDEATKIYIDNYLGTVNKTWYHEPNKESTDIKLRRSKEKYVRPLGTTAQAGAIRLGLSLALRCFVDKQTVEHMRLAGLLTHDIRTRERKKWGQEGARRKYTWKKR